MAPISSTSPEKVDVLICGSGSAGLCAAAYLARCGLSCRILESRHGPLALGQADGVQCRTVEVFESFGLAEDLLREAYHVIEDTFWSTSADGRLERTRTSPDTAKGLSHMPHVILNQARLHDLLIAAMKKWNGQEVEYGQKVLGLSIDSELAVQDPESYSVTVSVEKNGEQKAINARYVLGCDGAHSTVRRSLGFKMLGDSTDAVWGVMDVYPRTTFPDIRKKVILRTKAGSLLVIPREGDSLVRFYIELPAGTIAKEVQLDVLQNTARNIFKPYEMDFADTFWGSAYAIGQRHADFFAKDNRVFLTGDACHTHSPKAGQGMNTSLQDGYNIAWKLASVLKGQALPQLLNTYVSERGQVAKDLIEFDREFAKAFSSKGKEDFSELFIKSGRYTAGLTKRYDDSEITSLNNSDISLATGIEVGMRFPSTQVVRFSDAKPMQLSKALKSDGRWRIIAFAASAQDSNSVSTLNKLGDFLNSPEGPMKLYTRQGEDTDSFVEPIIVFSGDRQKFSIDQLSPVFWPINGRWKMRDLHKVYFDEQSYNNGHGHAYEFYGVNPEVGAVAVVRPDQHVALLTHINNHDAIRSFFAAFSVPSSGRA